MAGVTAGCDHRANPLPGKPGPWPFRYKTIEGGVWPGHRLLKKTVFGGMIARTSEWPGGFGTRLIEGTDSDTT